MNLVDSSGWVEYLADGPNAGFFADPLAKSDRLIVPTLSIFEVFRKVLRERGEDAALRAAAAMQEGRVVDLDADLAIQAAKVSHAKRLPMADGILYATALRYGAVLWTQDEDFKEFEGVRYTRYR